MNSTRAGREQSRPYRVVVICPWFYQGDAVGAAARDTYLALAASPHLDVSALWAVNDYPDVGGAQCSGFADLIQHEAYLAADVLIYSFAVYHPFFNALLLGNGHASQIVRFHNVTPRALMPAKQWPTIERSFVQIQAFGWADAIWADSRENLEELVRQGIDVRKIFVDPLGVNFPVRTRLSDKPRRTINLLYVGRFFESKGITDLISAARILRDTGSVPFHLSLAGNLRFSDALYVDEVRSLIRAHGLEDEVEILGTVSPEDLAEAYSKAHIFVTGSRHEGFCVPVIEGLAAGCIPVSYAVSNLRFVADGLGRLAPSPDPPALAKTLGAVVAWLAQDGHDMPFAFDAGPMTAARFDEAADLYVTNFTQQRFACRITANVLALAQSAKAVASDGVSKARLSPERATVQSKIVI